MANDRTQVANGENHKANVLSILTQGGYSIERGVIIGTTVYDTPYKVDGLASGRESTFVVQAIWQQTSGSASHKLPYTWMNIERSRRPTVVVLDGGGLPDSARSWFARQATPESALRAVYTLGELQRAINTGELVNVIGEYVPKVPHDLHIDASDPTRIYWMDNDDHCHEVDLRDAHPLLSLPRTARLIAVRDDVSPWQTRDVGSMSGG